MFRVVIVRGTPDKTWLVPDRWVWSWTPPTDPPLPLPNVIPGLDHISLEGGFLGPWSGGAQSHSEGGDNSMRQPPPP